MPKDDLYAPGLSKRKRPNGSVSLYWIADAKARTAGFRPKTVRLHGSLENPKQRLAIAVHCRRLQAEMREWMTGEPENRNPYGKGTLAWLCWAFETDEGSPIHDLRKATQIFYGRHVNILVSRHGQNALNEITGRHVRGWHKEWLGAFGERTAYGCIQTLRRVISYGCELRSKDAIELTQVLKRTEFAAPKARKNRPTHEQVIALREAAHRSGHLSIALATTLQFELGLRQKDIIGEWVGGQDGDQYWQWGLTWDQIDKDWILRKPTSKSNGSETAEHDLTKHPELMNELLRILESRRMGPVVLDERAGRPYLSNHFRQVFRKIKDAAGWPKDLWNMDLRAGAVSEAFEAGAEPADIMKTATHTQISTTMSYNRGKIVQTSRVAELRVARRMRRIGVGRADKT